MPVIPNGGGGGGQAPSTGGVPTTPLGGPRAALESEPINDGEQQDTPDSGSFGGEISGAPSMDINE